MLAKVQGQTLGCLNYQFSNDNTICHYGPFAVAVSQQGKGVGRALQMELERICQHKAIEIIEIEVVNHRQDLLNYYPKLGYTIMAEQPWDEKRFGSKKNLTRPSHFIIFHKKIGL